MSEFVPVNKRVKNSVSDQNTRRMLNENRNRSKVNNVEDPLTLLQFAKSLKQQNASVQPTLQVVDDYNYDYSRPPEKNNKSDRFIRQSFDKMDEDRYLFYKRTDKDLPKYPITYGVEKQNKPVVKQPNKQARKKQEYDFSKATGGVLINGEFVPTAESINNVIGGVVNIGADTFLNGNTKDDVKAVAEAIKQGQYDLVSDYARQWYARKFSDSTNNKKTSDLYARDKKNVVKKPVIKQQVVTEVEKEVLDEALAKQSIQSKDTSWWKHDGGVRDRTGNKIYLRRSIPITDDMKFGARNHGDYDNIPSSDAPMSIFTTPQIFSETGGKSRHAFVTYDDAINKYKLHTQADFYGQKQQFIGVTKEGKLRVGDPSLFKSGDIVAPISYKDIGNIPRNRDGSLKWVASTSLSGRYNPIISDDGFIFGAASAKGSKNGDVYDNVGGGSVLLRCGNELRLVQGSVNDMVAVHEQMMKNHKGKKVRWYILDNGSYSRGLRVASGNITALDMVDYYHSNPRGGNFIYIINQ